MLPKQLYTLFLQIFPYFVPHVLKYKGNLKTKSIDIWLDSGETLNFSGNKVSWELKKVRYVPMDTRPS